MFSPLQPAKLSLIVLLLISFVLSEGVHHNASPKKVGAPVAFVREHVAEILSVRQDEILETPDADETDGSLPTSQPDPTASGDQSTTTPPPTETDTTTSSETPTPTEPPTTTPSETGSSSTPSTSDSSTSSQSSISSTETTPTTTPTSKDTTTLPPQSTVTSRSTIVREITSDGRVYSSTDVVTSLIPTNTAAPIDSSPDTSSGMSAQTRKTVIGVVVGVGGAIFIGLVFLVFWKFWGRRRSARRGQDGDALMMTSPGEKGDSMSTSNPFQSTLESYHAPQRPVNASSNF